MILSHKQIEEIAAAVTKDFNEFSMENTLPLKHIMPRGADDRTAECPCG